MQARGEHGSRCTMHREMAPKDIPASHKPPEHKHQRVGSCEVPHGSPGKACLSEGVLGSPGHRCSLDMW